MGYNTNYAIETQPSEEKEDIVARLAELHGGSQPYNPFEDECKWYDWRPHCLEVSKEFPNVTIRITGEGEEHGDTWCAFFRCGRMQRTSALEWVAPIVPDEAIPWEAG